MRYIQNELLCRKCGGHVELTGMDFDTTESRWCDVWTCVGCGLCYWNTRMPLDISAYSKGEDYRTCLLAFGDDKRYLVPYTIERNNRYDK